MDILLPDVRVAKITPSLADNTGRFTSPLAGTVKTVSRPGDRWAFRLDYSNLQGQDRARLESTIASLRGAANRLLYSPGDYVQRGSFPSGEILSNNKFTNGTTSWSTAGTALSLAVQDRVLVATITGVSSNPQANQAISGAAQYMPHVARALMIPGRALEGMTTLTVQLQDGTFFTNSPGGGSDAALLTASAVIEGTAPALIAYWSASAGMLAGDYFLCPWTSLSRCMLVDNGPNLLEYSDTFAAPWAGTAASVTTGITGPDGSASAANLVDTTASSGHYLKQSATIGSATADYSLVVALKAGAQPYGYLQLGEGTGNTFATAYFNLSGGTIGTTSVGTNWSNVRAFIVPLGGGWYACAIVARKTNAATTLNAIVGATSGNGVTTYTGTGAAAISAFRATAAQSSVPTRPVQSGAAAVAAAAQTGSALYVKGLPASSSGLLLPGDWVEINKELKRVTAPLNSDAAERGYLQFSPPLRNSPNDNDPVITNMPMGRFITKSNETGWSSSPPYFATSSVDLVEAPQ